MHDVMAESSPAPVESAEPSTPQAATQPESTPAAAPTPEPPFHLHPRFRELTTQNRELKATLQQVQAQLRQIEQARSGGPQTDESRQLAEAAAALKRVFAADPELKAWFEARGMLPQLSQGYQQLSEAQKSSQRESARSYIGGLAKEAGLPTDPKWNAHLVRLVAGHAMTLPDGDARFESGDFGVLKDAFDAVKQEFFSTLQTAGAATTASVKAKTSKLPPAPRGGAAGEAAPKPIEAGKEREFTRGLHDRGLAMLKEAMTG